MIVMFQDAQLTATRVSNAPNAQPPLTGVVCPLRSAWLASGLRATPRTTPSYTSTRLQQEHLDLEQRRESVTIDARRASSPRRVADRRSALNASPLGAWCLFATLVIRSSPRFDSKCALWHGPARAYEPWLRVTFRLRLARRLVTPRHAVVPRHPSVAAGKDGILTQRCTCA